MTAAVDGASQGMSRRQGALAKLLTARPALALSIGSALLFAFAALVRSIDHDEGQYE